MEDTNISSNNHEKTGQEVSRRDIGRLMGAGALGIPAFGSSVEGSTLLEQMSSTDAQAQPWRPQYHFSTAGWINDPNGLVYKNGVYHLFYQAGEESRRWDHAVSRDLVNWNVWGTKIYDTPNIQAFSGGGVVDEQNTAGFGEDALILLYTGHYESGIEDQRLAYSMDNGRTIRTYEGNPIIPSDVGDFRDPNPLWYAPDGSWRMVVSRVKGTGDRPAGIEIYRSDDLINWTYLSTYRSNDELWETPSLYELPVEGTDKTRWVMTLSILSPQPNVGTSVEHHIGDFDGTEFTAERVVTADYGYDFYATQQWTNTPQNRGLNITWMNDWEYAMDLPTEGWSGAMTVPRTISLVGDGIEVRQLPVAELAKARTVKLTEMSSGTITPSTDPLAGSNVSGRTLELIIRLDPGSADRVGLRVREGESQKTVITYDRVAKQLHFDRTDAGVFFSDDQYGTQTAPMEVLDDNTIKLRVLVDRSSVEVFANEGSRTMTNRVFPDWDSTGVSLFTEGGSAEIQHLVAYDLAAEDPPAE